MNKQEIISQLEHIDSLREQALELLTEDEECTQDDDIGQTLIECVGEIQMCCRNIKEYVLSS